MQRLNSHRDFVTVLKKRRKVGSSDIVAHYYVRDGAQVCAQWEPESEGGITIGSDITSSPVVFSATHMHDQQTSSKPPTRRLGLAVAKSVGNAVTRNRVKRRFRVIAQSHENVLPTQCDVVLRAKPTAASASFASLDEQVTKIFTKIAMNANRETDNAQLRLG